MGPASPAPVPVKLWSGTTTAMAICGGTHGRHEADHPVVGLLGTGRRLDLRRTGLDRHVPRHREDPVRRGAGNGVVGHGDCINLVTAAAAAGVDAVSMGVGV